MSFDSFMFKWTFNSEHSVNIQSQVTYCTLIYHLLLVECLILIGQSLNSACAIFGYAMTAELNQTLIKDSRGPVSYQSALLDFMLYPTSSHVNKHMSFASKCCSQECFWSERQCRNQFDQHCCFQKRRFMDYFHYRKQGNPSFCCNFWVNLLMYL